MLQGRHSITCLNSVLFAAGVDPTAGMSERQKKLFELQQRLKASRKANQTAVVAERRRKQAPTNTEATEGRKWYEEKKKRRAAELERLGLDEKDVRTNASCLTLPEHSGTLVKLNTTCLPVIGLLIKMGMVECVHRGSGA